MLPAIHVAAGLLPAPRIPCTPQTVERVTLARQCPTLLTLLKALPARIALVEPTYKQIVVVYRCALLLSTAGVRCVLASGPAGAVSLPL